MSLSRSRSSKFDWLSILLFLLLIGFGYLNILSASSSGEITSYLDMSQPYGKQLVFIVFTLVLIILVLAIEAKFYERFASILYLGCILSLVGLLIGFGKNVNGATSWYAIGSMTLQPSEFAKFATALAVAKYTSDLQTNIKNFKDQLKLFSIIGIPAVLIILQNDTGSTLVYLAFFFVLFREGLPKIYLHIGFTLLVTAILALKLGILFSSIIAILIILFLVFKLNKNLVRNRFITTMFLSIVMVGYSFAVQYVYENKLPSHQKDRISLWLRLEKDPNKLEQIKKSYAYNLLESEKAISSGGFSGKGFMQGTRTIGNFVPEQHTDYIFSTVGEEWGFTGSSLVIILFVLLIIRILHRAELQKSQFSRVYGYSVASILFIHFLINIGMVMGLIPTIGIPLPFFSYGGSSLWGFTILLFIFIKLDSNRINEW